MAFAGPQLALRPNGDEDVDFFDQLADDLGQRSDGMLQNFEAEELEREQEPEEKGEVGLEEAHHFDHAANAEAVISGDEFCMQERVPKKKSFVNTVVASSTGRIDMATSEAIAASHLDGFFPCSVEERTCKVPLDISNADRNADGGSPCNAPSVESHYQDHASHQDAVINALVDLDPYNHAMENAGLELATNLSGSSHSFHKNVSLPGSFQPSVKELQWSTFTEIYTPNDGSNALNDFLSELGGGTEQALEVGLSSTPNTDLLSKWKFENGNFTDQSITNSHHFRTDIRGSSEPHDNGGYGMHSHLNTQQSQLELNSSVFSTFHGISEQPPGESNVAQVTNGIGFVDSNMSGHSPRMHLQGVQNVVNEEKQSLMSSNEVYSSHQQVYTSQPWESMYPGWYFDYSTNEWKQLEGWDFNVSSEHHIGESTAMTEDYSTSSAANATLSQLKFDQGVPTMGSHLDLNTRQNVETGYDEAADVSGSLVEEQVALGGSVWSTGEGVTVSTSLVPLFEGEEKNLPVKYEQRNSDGALQPQRQTPWEEQYPGWYFDYQINQWRQVIAGDFVDSYGRNVEPSVVEEDPRMEPDHLQLNANQSVIQPEGSGAVHGSEVSGVVASTQILSFHAWSAPAVTAHFSDPVSEEIGNVKEVLSVERNGLSHGLQSYSNGATQYFRETETPVYNSYGLQSDSQSHSSYGAVRETKYTSPDDRPSHALVAFGFGGKLVTMKASANSIPESVVLHDLNQLIQASAENSQNAQKSYFSSLNRGGLAGPLVGSGVATKEVLKWVDDQIANCEVEDPYRTESLRVLWGVLRIVCIHYGKIRPTHGSSSLKNSSEDGPELDLGRLLSTSCCPQVEDLTATSAGLQRTPPEPQLQSIVLEMRKRLVEGKRKEALQLAQQGQLWGPALVLALHLGEKAYAETVLQMSQQQFVPGCPLRTLMLLLGGQTGELFTAMSLPSPLGAEITKKDSAGGMLSDWMGNLSIIAANPTNGDEQVITHLGDCLWKDYGEVYGAHTCYLVADAMFEPFSENARLCLVGADHFKWQRTFATPMSIQRTELYEYAKALGNPQFVLLPFQPYKLLYAYMLVEGGKISEARRYCQAVSKALKNAGRTSEIEFCRQAAVALEERLRIHCQGGYNLNSATGKLVGKFIGTLDSTLHRIMGGPPPRQASEPSLNRNPKDWYSNNPKLVDSAKIRETSLDPSLQKENSALFNNRKMESTSRSISEPNLSWNREKKDHNATAGSQTSQVDDAAPKENKSEVRRTGYLGRLLSTAVGFMKSNTKKADLGGNNKFYYNKELKRWVEEGAEQTVEEMALPPPPITTGLDSKSRSASLDTLGTKRTEGPGAMDGNSGALSQLPLLPPSGSQYSARGRLNGVRARYVDTFNKNGTLAATSTNSPLVPTPGWAMVPPPTQFFMPVQTATSINNAAEASDKELLDLSNSLSASRSTTQTNVLQTENESVVPNETSSSVTSVSSISNHVGIIGFDNNTPASAQGEGDFVSQATQFSSQSLVRGTTMLGEMPSFFTTDTSVNSAQIFCLPNDSNTESGVALDSYMHTAKFRLPVPPVIQPAVAVDNGFSNENDEQRESALSNDVHEGFIADMQEVEL
ncbi:hypothetical protein GOP47_0025624 [Adiantum capillus-veneris]|uniref:Protein transport protein sec16 n=1 Tax=Adiantum capillus-veneris TaxID=13818 RepID=A0A9D4Z337_ADICA|nr:hypothetical protein GOP47_0025624 [Adiantum capillus-veneris]